jgi:hypothetical protein
MWSAHRIPQLHFQLSKPGFDMVADVFNEIGKGTLRQCIADPILKAFVQRYVLVGHGTGKAFLGHGFVTVTRTNFKTF